MGFENEYEEFVHGHVQRRTGERLRRLHKGLGHAERRFLETVWWPTFHHFDHLHPEYEIHDYKDGYRYIDFAYIQPYFQVAIEIDGLESHWRNITKWQYSITASAKTTSSSTVGMYFASRTMKSMNVGVSASKPFSN